jgi:hypothetical protein
MVFSRERGVLVGLPGAEQNIVVNTGRRQEYAKEEKKKKDK